MLRFRTQDSGLLHDSALPPPSLSLRGLEQCTNHLGVLFKFFGLGFPVCPNGLGVIFSLSEPAQQGGPFIERSDGGPQGSLQAIRMIREKTVGRIGMPHMTAELEGRSSLCFPQRPIAFRTHKHRGWEVCRQTPDQSRKRVYATRRGADDDDIASIDSLLLCGRRAYMLWRIECDFILLREANATTSRSGLVLFWPFLPRVTRKPGFPRGRYSINDGAICLLGRSLVWGRG